jgi:hypothetical protein
MNLYAAVINCKSRTRKKSAKVKNSDETFRIPVPADSPAEAKIRLESVFPWTYYKHVKVEWELIAENV